MAGDWIALRTNLHEDPAVICVAEKTKLDEFGVVGRLHRLWSWVNENTIDGHARCVTDTWIDRLVGVTGFAQALVSCGWLQVKADGFVVPKFENWNSQSAKQRLLSAKRKQKQRSPARTLESRSCHAPGVTKTGPEERRVEVKEKTEDPPTPQGGSDARPRGEIIKPDSFEELVKAWTESQLPGAGQIHPSSTRRGWFEQRQSDDFWRTNWRAAIGRLAQSPKAKGHDPSFPRGVRLDEFLKNPDYVARILEGEFDAVAQRGPRAAESTADMVNRLFAEKSKTNGVHRG